MANAILNKREKIKWDNAFQPDLVEDVNDYVSANITDIIDEHVEDINVYSTEERAIGRWSDGRTIYRKTFTVNLSVTATTFILDIPEPIEIIGLTGYWHYIAAETSNNVFIPIDTLLTGQSSPIRSYTEPSGTSHIAGGWVSSFNRTFSQLVFSAEYVKTIL